MFTRANVAMTLRNVGVYYHTRKKRPGMPPWVLKDISFDLLRGETFGIIGRNGVGKSTLLRIMAGIIAPDEGEVVNLAGHATLFSLQAGFVPHLNGRDNAILSALLLGLTRREAKAKLESIIDYSGIRYAIDEPTGAYSTGMRARLGFAVAFHADPPILLIDEVLGVGDAEFMQQSTESMKKRIESDRTVVIVSHNILMLQELCSRILWIEGGAPRALGEAKDIAASYLQSVVRERVGNTSG